jgi:DNA-binding response OmpR family regulator
MRMARSLQKQLGVVMLTARGALADRLEGFAGGADHYLVKPVDLLELAAIVDALLRRIGADWVYRESSSELVDPQGRRFTLTRQECVLFREVAGVGAGTVVQRRQIVEALGGQWASYDLRRLDTMVSRLRSRWRQLNGDELPLRTLHREGYSFGAVISLL